MDGVIGYALLRWVQNHYRSIIGGLCFLILSISPTIQHLWASIESRMIDTLLQIPYLTPLSLLQIGLFVVGLILILSDKSVRNYVTKLKVKKGEDEQSVERIEGVQAYLFFPVHIPRSDRTLEYHEKHFSHRLIVNYKTEPPKAYFLPTDSYGWKFINKYTDLWISENDPDPSDDGSTEKWCKGKGYQPPKTVATKNNLLEETPMTPVGKSMFICSKCHKKFNFESVFSPELITGVATCPFCGGSAQRYRVELD
jgi:hypothetical protein